MTLRYTESLAVKDRYTPMLHTALPLSRPRGWLNIFYGFNDCPTSSPLTSPLVARLRFHTLLSRVPASRGRDAAAFVCECITRG